MQNIIEISTDQLVYQLPMATSLLAELGANHGPVGEYLSHCQICLHPWGRRPKLSRTILLSGDLEMPSMIFLMRKG